MKPNVPRHFGENWRSRTVHVRTTPPGALAEGKRSASRIFEFPTTYIHVLRGRNREAVRFVAVPAIWVKNLNTNEFRYASNNGKVFTVFFSQTCVTRAIKQYGSYTVNRTHQFASRHRRQEEVLDRDIGPQKDLHRLLRITSYLFRFIRFMKARLQAKKRRSDPAPAVRNIRRYWQGSEAGEHIDIQYLHCKCSVSADESVFIYCSPQRK